METGHSPEKPGPGTFHPEKETPPPDSSEHWRGNDEQKYRLLFEDTDECVVVLQNGRFCFANKKLADIIGYSPDDLISKKFPDFAHPDDQELVSNWYQRCLQGDKTNLTHPFRFITCTGEVRWVLGNSLKINWNGQCAVMGFFTDITPQNPNGENLTDPLQLFKDLFESSPIGALCFNSNGDILYSNQAAADIFGYQSPEKMFSGKSMQTDKNQKTLDAVFKTLKTANTLKQHRLTIKTRTGRSKTLQCNAVQHKNRVWMLFPDAERSYSPPKKGLRYEIQAQATLINAFDDWALLLDLDGRIRAINPTAAEKLGGHPQDFVGLNVFSGLPFDPAIFKKNKFNKAMRLNKPIQFQANFKDQFYEIRIKPLIDPPGGLSGMALFAKDITGLLQHEKEVLTSQTELKCEITEQAKELRTKTRLLEEANIALKVLLKKRDEDKLNLEQRIMNSVKELVLPYVAKLDRRITDEKGKTYLGILEANLKSILSPFSQKLSSVYMLLSPSEIEVAEYIKYGKSSKEISKMLNLSVKTIETYRANIRKKTGLRNKKTNLRTYLLSFKNI